MSHSKKEWTRAFFLIPPDTIFLRLVFLLLRACTINSTCYCGLLGQQPLALRPAAGWQGGRALKLTASRVWRRWGSGSCPTEWPSWPVTLHPLTPGSVWNLLSVWPFTMHDRPEQNGKNHFSSILMDSCHVTCFLASAVQYLVKIAALAFLTFCNFGNLSINYKALVHSPTVMILDTIVLKMPTVKLIQTCYWGTCIDGRPSSKWRRLCDQ